MNSVQGRDTDFLPVRCKELTEVWGPTILSDPVMGSWNTDHTQLVSPSETDKQKKGGLEGGKEEGTERGREERNAQSTLLPETVSQYWVGRQRQCLGRNHNRQTVHSDSRRRPAGFIAQN